MTRRPSRAQSPTAYLLRLAAIILAPILLSGCYIARAAYEEGRILWNRKPIDDVLARKDLSADTRAKLETVLAVRKFAADRLGENVGGAYESIAPVDQNAVVYVVMAAPRDSLVPYTWWFPIVGSVPYRGYFDKNDALAEAASLEAQGLDTMVRPSVAFSSLGFFSDPLLTNLLKLDRVELAGVLIHELFHRTYYLASDAMFDESAANYVGSAGAVAFFAATDGESAPSTKAAREILESDLKFARFLLQEQARLLDIYMADLPKAELDKRREAAFAAIKADYAALEPSLSGLERFDLDKQPLNNAVLVNYLIYFHELDNFAALDRMNHGDMRETIAQIISIAKAHPEDPFYAIWETTRAAPPAPEGGALVVLSASAQQPSPAAASNPNWCPGAPASPPPPHFETGSEGWASANKQCSPDRSTLSPRKHREVDVGCRHICGYAQGLWGSSKNPPSTTHYLSTDKPQGPFPLPGGGAGYVLPLPSFALSPTAGAAPSAPQSGSAGFQSDALPADPPAAIAAAIARDNSASRPPKK